MDDIDLAQQWSKERSQFYTEETVRLAKSIMRACEVIADNGCDCDEDEPGECLAHRLEAALRGAGEQP